VGLAGVLCCAPLAGVLFAEQAPNPTPADAAKSKDAIKAEKRQAALEGLEQQMRYASATERKRAIRRVTRLEAEEQPPFLKLLDEFARDDLDYSVREASLRTMGKAKYEAGLPTMVAALKDERREVVLAAIAALDALESPEARTPLAELLKTADFTESDPMIGAAIRLLGKLKYREIAPFLKEKAAAESTQNAARLAIVLFFGASGADDMNSYLVDLVQDDDAEIITRAYAVNSIGKLKNKANAPALREELDKIRNLANPRERARFSSLKLQLLTALVRLGDDSVDQELLAAARDDDARVRVRAIVQLGEARLEKARPLLRYIIDHDASKGARQAATKALKQINGESPDGADDSAMEDQDSPDDEPKSDAGEAGD
jgi:HEAT repeat protein